MNPFRLRIDNKVIASVCLIFFGVYATITYFQVREDQARKQKQAEQQKIVSDLLTKFGGLVTKSDALFYDNKCVEALPYLSSAQNVLIELEKVGEGSDNRKGPLLYMKGTCEARAGDSAEAEKDLLAGTTLFEKMDGGNTLPYILLELSDMYQKQNRFAEEEKINQTAVLKIEGYLDQSKKNLDPLDPRIAHFHFLLGKVYRNMNRISQSDQEFSEALSIFNMLYGPSPNVDAQTRQRIEAIKFSIYPHNNLVYRSEAAEAADSLSYMQKEVAKLLDSLPKNGSQPSEESASIGVSPVKSFKLVSKNGISIQKTGNLLMCRHDSTTEVGDSVQKLSPLCQKVYYSEQ